MTESNNPGIGPNTSPSSGKPPESSSLVRQFVEHWGMMARSWGINPTMGELFALLYVTGTSWTADELREHLRVSRGNVSMNLRELIAWGVVHKIHRQGERREFFRAESDVWTLFRRILAERKRRELDPTLALLDRTVLMTDEEPTLVELRSRILSLKQFFATINTLATRLDALGPDDLEDLLGLLDVSEPQNPSEE
ncbi:GbsR/MarR family transcriptional regulator [soil metagenome]